MDRLILRTARALLWALVGAFVGAASGAVRAGASGASTGAAWFALAGLLALPSAVVTVLGAFALRKLGVIARTSALRWAVRVVLASALFTPAAFVGAAALKATTHHRGLAGATFGAYALATAAVAVVLSRRLAPAAERFVRRHPALSKVGLAAYALAWVAGALLAGGPAAASAGIGWADLSPRLQVASVDAGIWLAVLVAGAWAPVPSRLPSAARGAVAGLTLALALDGAALWLSRPALAQTVRAQAPLSAAVARMAELW